MLRDALLPILWLEGWAGNTFVWRGNAMSVAESRASPDGAPALGRELVRTSDVN